jgi:hypothetical protein
MTDVELGVMQQQSKKCQGLMTAITDQEKKRKESTYTTVSGGEWPCRCLDLRLLTSRTMKE